MNGFFKNVLANITAIFLVVMLIVGFFFMLGIMSSLGDGDKVRIKDNSVLTIKLDDPVIESSTELEANIFSMGNNEHYLYDILQAINAAKTDDNIRGISIESDNVRAGLTQLDDIRKALEDFKKSGKFVYAYGNNVSQKAYHLGSVADRYYLHPAGGIELRGMSSEITFLKDFADKYGIGIDIIRHGKFKAAVEPFMRNDMSPENREQMTTLLNDMWSNVSADIKRSRKMDNGIFKTTVDSLYGIIPELSIRNRLADKLLQKSEYHELIKKEINGDNDKELQTVSIGKYIKSLDKKQSGKEQIAVLYASGEILNGKGFNGIHAENYVKEIRKLAKNDKIKAVVLRVNSPGGSANASDEILFELQQLKQKKPLIVSFGDYAASGGYYIAMAGDKIYSEPNTITGSIGVFGMIVNFKELTKRNGITSDVVETNANSNMYSPFKGVSPGTVNILTRSVEGTYNRFVHFVTKNRKKSFEQIDQIGGGRVWSGARAKELGLVDELGSLNDAIAFAEKKAGVKKAKIVSYPKEVSPFEQFFKDFEQEDLAAKIIERKLGKENGKVLNQILRSEWETGVQMRLPYQITF